VVVRRLVQMRLVGGRDSRCVGDCINGNGMFYFETGETYSGQWKGSLKHGNGTQAFPTYSGGADHGGTYVGQWYKNRAHGHGVRTYEGGLPEELRPFQSWASGRPGIPRKLNLTGKYDGGWVFGRRQGHGTVTGPGGHSYEGTVLRQAMHGHGRQTANSVLSQAVNSMFDLSASKANLSSTTDSSQIVGYR
jgi:1-phosphatidylinositol-4-phosphate 5-kinase